MQPRAENFQPLPVLAPSLPPAQSVAEEKKVPGISQTANHGICTRMTSIKCLSCPQQQMALQTVIARPSLPSPRLSCPLLASTRPRERAVARPVRPGNQDPLWRWLHQLGRLAPGLPVFEGRGEKLSMVEVMRWRARFRPGMEWIGSRVWSIDRAILPVMCLG